MPSARSNAVDEPQQNAISRVADALRAGASAVAFTGAGISTESGIPDFRSPGGVWSRYQPVLYPDFLADHDARVRYWKMKHELWGAYAGVEPNAGHLALARLEAAGRLTAVLTQNIDGLHQAAGSGRVIELHGTDRFVACVACGHRTEAGPVHERVDAGEAVPQCDQCGGWLKPATISFGQQLDEAVLAEAFERASEATAMLAIGSSLVVEPAASLPVQAKRSGAFLAIINRDQTPLDSIADVVIREPIGQVLPAIADAVLASRNGIR